MGTFSSTSESTQRSIHFNSKSLSKFLPLSKPFYWGPYVPINFTVGKFQIKTADSFREKKECYRLRFDIFHRELATNRKILGIDRDRFDDVADLLIIKDTTIDKVVGTYRLICSEISQKFCSSTEFSIGNFVKVKDIKVELSRACVHRDYRKGVVIALLWQGLSQYLQAVGAKYLFGLSSVNHVSPKQVLGLMYYFKEQGAIDDRYGILPTRKYCQSASILHSFNDLEPGMPEAKELVPPLLRAYLNAGAKLATVPAYDATFNCYDFLTILDASNLNPTVGRKFRTPQQPS